jgi:hypothetical protein
MRVNAPNATKKYPSYRKKLRLKLPTRKAENVEGKSKNLLYSKCYFVMEKIKCFNADTEI